jgi:hypothetical protein
VRALQVSRNSSCSSTTWYFNDMQQKVKHAAQGVPFCSPSKDSLTVCADMVVDIRLLIQV